MWESLQVVRQLCSASEIAPRGEEAWQGPWAVPAVSPGPLFNLSSHAFPGPLLCSGCGHAFTGLATRRPHPCLRARVHAAARLWSPFFSCPNSTSLPGSSSHCEAFLSYSDPFSSPLVSSVLALLWLLHTADLQPNLSLICGFYTVHVLQLLRHKRHCN